MSACETVNLCWIGSCKPRTMTAKLSPAQWIVPHFFTRQPGLPELSDSAEFQAKTQGTASQAIKALKAGGYLARQRSKADEPSVLSSPSRSAERTFN
jgi:DNA-binding MarR family transcriptional regulator